MSSSPSARCKFSGFIPNSAFQIPHSKVGREGIEPLAATSIIKGAWFTARHEGHDPVWNVECGIGNAEHWFAHISQAIFRTPHSEFPIPTKSSRVDSNHRSTACKAGAFAARPRDVFDYSEFRIPHSEFKKYPTEESNLVQLFRRQSCIQHTRRAKCCLVLIVAFRSAKMCCCKSGREIRTLTTCFKGKSPVLGIPEWFGLRLEATTTLRKRLIPDLNRRLCRDRAVSIPNWTNEPTLISIFKSALRESNSPNRGGSAALKPISQEHSLSVVA